MDKQKKFMFLYIFFNDTTCTSDVIKIYNRYKNESNNIHQGKYSKEKKMNNLVFQELISCTLRKH